MRDALVVLFLALLLGTQAVTSDIYLPSLPAISAGFGASVGQAQLTLTAMLLAFGVSQLFWGPVSDRVGRRPVLLAGLGLYLMAGTASALANSITALIACRAVQGVAMGAGVMCARAIVRDLYTPSHGARVMSKGYSGLGVLATLCVPLGAWLSTRLGWRASLWALVAYGGVCLVLVAFFFKETLKRPNPQALNLRVLARTWGSILSHPVFLTYSLLTVGTYAGLFTYIAASSFVLIGQMGLTPLQYSVALLVSALVYIPGTFYCRWLLARVGVRRAVATGAAITLTGGTAMGLLALAGVNHVAALVVPFCIYMVGHGFHQACGQSGAVGPFPHAAGAASALNGFLMMAAAFAIGGWLGHALQDSALPVALGVWFWSAVVALTAWTLVQKYGAPESDGPVPAAAALAKRLV